MNNAAPGSIAHEVIQFLRRQPEVEVSTTALATGIGRNSKRLAQHLAPAAKAGLLARRVDNGFAFWRLGANTDPTQPPAEASPDDLEQQRVVKVSAHATTSIFAYADQRKAAPFSVALHTDGRMAIERHGRLVLELTDSERIHLVNAAMNGVKP